VYTHTHAHVHTHAGLSLWFYTLRLRKVKILTLKISKDFYYNTSMEDHVGWMLLVGWLFFLSTTVTFIL